MNDSMCRMNTIWPVGKCYPRTNMQVVSKICSGEQTSVACNPSQRQVVIK